MKIFNPFKLIGQGYRKVSLLVYFGVLMPAKAHAQEQDLAGVMARVTAQLSGAGTLIATVAAVIGFGLVAFGLFKLIMRRPGGQDTIGGAIGMIIGGALLLVVGTIASIGSTTVVDEGARGGLGNIGL